MPFRMAHSLASVLAAYCNGNCVDTGGVVSCEFNVDYEKTGLFPDTTCTNIDECNDGHPITRNCGAGTCVDNDENNSSGGFNCTCNKGYVESGTYALTTCTNINECDSLAFVLAACSEAPIRQQTALI